MEIEGVDGSNVQLKEDGSSVAFGRGLGFNTKDRTVSRRHVLFQPCKTKNQTESRVSFQVIGRNPLWLRSGDGGSEIRVFRKLEKGEMAIGDWFCISSQSPVWFNLKRIGIGEESDFSGSDVSEIDPVKEFGFLVIGHEFDNYPKKRICEMKNWDWFLEEDKENSEDDDGSNRKKRKGSGRRRRRKDGGNGDGDGDDEDWTGESEEDKETVAKVRKIQESKYSTRSKNKNKSAGKKEEGRRRKKETFQSKAISFTEEDNEEEDDDTLGGFIVDDNGDDDEEEQVEESDEEEEEFIDEDDEEEDLED